MITASELAGFVAAHAIWSLSDAGGFIPMVAFGNTDGQRNLERLALADGSTALEQARARLEDYPDEADDGVLAYDGRVTVEGGKLDAVILELRSYAFPSARATIAVPYTPPGAGPFRVHKPKLVAWHECGDFDIGAAFEAFFRGVDSHEKGAEAWYAALDESK